MLIGVYGDVGSGKTILLTKIARDYPKIPVLSNFKINLPNVKPLEPDMLLDIEPSEDGIIVLITEAYTWLESRTSQSKVNRYMSYVGFQSRKRDLDIVCDAQLRSSLDLRFKDMENYTIFCGDRPKPKISTEPFLYRVIKGFRYRDMIFPFKKAKKLFSIYDTKEVIMPHDIEELKADLISSNPVSLNRTINDLVSLLKETFPEIMDKEIKEITHDFVSDVLLQIGKPVSFESFVYTRLRSQIQQHEKN